eukprot:gnl/MRDRNA2_/MRDRNA2_30997_c0_seq1.p1 gnl/MRDRNA2_/MRDRNA2_30997_c0~~gnl/MRDRNA2_/MRDRNA2_30997_c0_seq1.p1  ORF type:complete len:248 (+),score=36.58 gnl/MRDRNA2_/MRDRNA2_30997_c0_seq1:126-869(+)
MPIHYVSICNDTQSTVESWWILANTKENTDLHTLGPGSTTTQAFLAMLVGMEHEACVRFQNGETVCTRVWVPSDIRHVTHQCSKLFDQHPSIISEKLPEIIGDKIHERMFLCTQSDVSEPSPEPSPHPPSRLQAAQSKFLALQPSSYRGRYIILALALALFMFALLSIQNVGTLDAPTQELQKVIDAYAQDSDRSSKVDTHAHGGDDLDNEPSSTTDAPIDGYEDQDKGASSTEELLAQVDRETIHP